MTVTEKRKWTRHPKIQIGDQYGYLTVVESGPRNKLGATWWCVCKCNRFKIIDHPIYDSHLKRLNTYSCGCYHKEKASEAKFIHGESPSKNKPASATQSRWNGMKQRCTNPKATGWEDYGGRSPNPVTVCQRWMFDYLAFREDMRRCPMDRWEIDRIDNDKGYWCGKPECPECGPKEREPNCRWVPPGENERNKKDVKRYLFRGVWLTTGQISDCIQNAISCTTIAGRLESGWTVQEAITELPEERIYTYEYKGKQQTPQELSEVAGIEGKLITQRIREFGWEVEEAVETPLNVPGRPPLTFEWEGRSWTLKELADHTGLSTEILYQRLIRYKWLPERAVRLQPSKGNHHTQ